MDKAAMLFFPGVQAATALRHRLLDELRAEPAWLFEEQSGTIVWLPSTVATRFIVEPVNDSVPGLAALHVITSCSTVNDSDAASVAVADLNLHTTVNRWALIPAVSSDGVARVVVGVTFIVGDPTVEVPFAAVLATVGEQVAKATSVVTNGYDTSWGEPDIAYGPEGMRQSADWSRVAFFYDDHITPYGGTSASVLLAALIAAFELERQDQFTSCEAAWFGSGDESGFTCEVPYGPGPFPMGVIGMRGAVPHLSGPDNDTGLVQGFLVNNPHVGHGLLLTLRPYGEGDETEPVASRVVRLNGLTRQRDAANPLSAANTPRGPLGYAHGLGAWIAHSQGPTYACFIPAAWQYLLDRDDLVRLFRVLLNDLARNSWAARAVLGPSDAPDPRESSWTRPPSGLAAGARARGACFGEPGAGVDPGAAAVAFAWRNLVADDAQWARTFTDLTGFRFWTGPTTVDITAEPCECDDQPGAMVRIETPVALANELDPAALDVAQAGGIPMALVVQDDLVVAHSSLHVHADTIHWAESWSVPLAVAQTLLAERLTHGDTLVRDLPEGSARPDREDMLSIWDPAANILTSEHASTTPTGLLTPCCSATTQALTCPGTARPSCLPGSSTSPTRAESRRGRRSRPRSDTSTTRAGVAACS